MGLCNCFCDSACYLPVVGCVTFDNERKQDSVAALLLLGNAPAKGGAAGAAEAAASEAL